MGWFTNTEKKIADTLVSTFSKAEAVEEKVSTVVVTEIKTVAENVISDERKTFTAAHNAAQAANTDVNKLKAELQAALAKSAQLHQAAIDAANAARAAAEADVAKFTAAAAAHSADLATQTSAQTIAPAAPAADATPVQQ